ncbi:PAS domain-containing protein [Emcibacter sp.]|uniref:PAS domain-containing protein n=1 Tax=Emcibacter sp. TaxID=1979954 RepID=UPI002AA73C77|nr:PAS domain-containing protein [Emcibacter sp.]
MFISPVEISDIDPDHLQELFSYWQNIKGDKHMPSRKDFRPEEIPSLLPYLALFDVSDKPYRYYTRLVGTETVKAMGFDFTGKYLDEVPSLSAVRERFDRIAENGIPYLYKGQLVWSEKSYLDYYALALPFSKDGQAVDILMYGTYYHFPEGERPTGYL